MAKHEFGIMDIAPTLKQEYNKYEPEKYHCISVEDEYIESLLKELSVIPCYWHSLQQEERGLPEVSVSSFSDSFTICIKVANSAVFSNESILPSWLKSNRPPNNPLSDITAHITKKIISSTEYLHQWS